MYLYGYSETFKYYCSYGNPTYLPLEYLWYTNNSRELGYSPANGSIADYGTDYTDQTQNNIFGYASYNGALIPNNNRYSLYMIFLPKGTTRFKIGGATDVLYFNGIYTI